MLTMMAAVKPFDALAIPRLGRSLQAAAASSETTAIRERAAEPSADARGQRRLPGARPPRRRIPAAAYYYHYH